MSQRGNATDFQDGIITAKNPIGYLEAFDRFILSIFPLNCFRKKVQVTTVIENNIRKCPLGFPCLTFNLSLSRRAWGDKNLRADRFVFLLSIFNTVAHLKKNTPFTLLLFLFFFLKCCIKEEILNKISDRVLTTCLGLVSDLYQSFARTPKPINESQVRFHDTNTN